MNAVKGKSRDRCRCCSMKGVRSVSFDGLENEKKKDDQSNGLDRTTSLHERETSDMLYGAVVAKNLDADAFSTGDGYEV